MILHYKTLEWSLKVNEDIEKLVFGMTPFPSLKNALQNEECCGYHGCFTNTL